MNSTEKLKILAIPGSVRTASFNRGLLVAAGKLAHPGVDVEIYDGIRALPIFSEELEGEELPDTVFELDSAIRSSDAVLIATPEYNGSLPGGLKNLLDWGSRPYANGAFNRKPVAVVGASAGQYGAARAVQATSDILRHIGAHVIEGHLTVGNAHRKFDSDGVLREPMTIKSMGELVNRLVTRVRLESPV